MCIRDSYLTVLNSLQVLIKTGASIIAIPIIVIIEVAAADPNKITSSLTKLSYINQDKDCALPWALNPIMGSNTLKLSLKEIKATKVTTG